MSGDRVIPKPTPETQHYWDGARQGELRLQKCDDCGHTYFPPARSVPPVARGRFSVITASGRGKLFSYVINHLPSPGFDDAQFAIAVVELEEGPRLMSNILDCPQTPEALQLDMALEVTFEKLSDEITLPQFRPAK